MARILRPLAVLAALLVALPATAQTAAAATVGVPFALRLGGEAAIEGTEVRVRFDRVTEDSRCPIDVMCVWAGVFRMVLVVESTAGAAPAASDVVLDTMGGEGTAAGLHFRLLRVKPPRLSSMGADIRAPYTVLIQADREQ